MNIPNETSISTYYNIRQELNNLGEAFRSFLTQPKYLLPFLQPGRLIKVFLK